MRETARTSEKKSENICRGEGGRGEGRRREDKRGQARRGEEGKTLSIKHQMLGTDTRHKETSVCSACDVFRNYLRIILVRAISVVEYAFYQNCRKRIGSNSRNTFSIE